MGTISGFIEAESDIGQIAFIAGINVIQGSTRRTVRAFLILLSVYANTYSKVAVLSVVLAIDGVGIYPRILV